MDKPLLAKTHLAIVILIVIVIIQPAHAQSQVNDLLLIPLPKKVTELSGSIPVTAASAFVVENIANRKHQIGIEEVNAQVKSLGGAALPEKIYASINEVSDNSIIVGNLKSPWIQELCHSHNLEYQDPGEQGYVIKFFTRGTKQLILIGGGGDQGTLYGCITLRSLLKKAGDSLCIARYDIWDKPDFTYRTADSIIACRAQAKATIDFALRHKINMIWSGFSYNHDTLTSDKEWFKNINDYAWERGIRIVYDGWWNIGEAPVPQGANQYYYPYSGMIGHRGMLFCWSNDELLSKKGDDLSNFIQNTGAKAIYLHCIDSGGVNDPELWSKKCDRCRTRFGEDRALADAHVINTFYNKIKKASQDTLFITVVYPYVAKYTASSYPNIVNWLGKLTRLIPQDVFLVVREGTADDISRWCRMIRQPSFAYHATEPKDWDIQRPYITSFRFARTFYAEGKDNIYWNTAYRVMSKIQVMGTAEYSWNIEAPGSEYLLNLENPPLWKQVADNPEEIDKGFLPRACKILFDNASNEMAEVVSFNLSPYLMVNPQPWLTREYCQEQLEKANRALEILKTVESKIPAESKDFYGAHKANSTACQCFAQVRIGLYNINKYLNENVMDAARSEKFKILDLLNKGEQAFYQLEKSDYVPWNGGIDFLGCKDNLIDELNKLPIPPDRPKNVILRYLQRRLH
ncbi:MAG: hypothetical protein AB1454_14980 [Candidatus Auribacterota bacterium]